MINQVMTDQAISEEIGARLEQLRLEQNITQQALASEVGITAKTYRQMIQGQGKFINMIAALRALGALGHLDNFLPPSQFSPLERLKLEGHKRKRARPVEATPSEPDDLDW